MAEAKETSAQKKARLKRERKLREDRAAEVESAMVLGLRSKEIERTISTRYHVSERMVRKDMEKIRERWAEEAEEEGKGPYRRNAMRMRIEGFYRKCLSDKAHGAAARALALLLDLDGLKVLKIEHSGEVAHGLKDMTSDDKRRRLEELMEIARKRAAAKQEEKPN